MTTSEHCRVDGCHRGAAASLMRDHLPGPLPLCAIHTEDFRMNGPGWLITWQPGDPEPVSVVPAAVRPVGRDEREPARSSWAAAPGGINIRSRIGSWRRKGS